MGIQECDQENIQNWLECDVDDPGHQVLTDDEIIASVIDDQDLCDEEEEPSDEDCAEKGPSSEEAFHCLETTMKWVEQQEECDAVQLLCLKRLRDLAAKSECQVFHKHTSEIIPHTVFRCDLSCDGRLNMEDVE
ncbi:hypothetical protein C0J52_23952 [Blattella germanica]|nr:hypothetical protein C0J52_23952 [Blattella germanica]